MTPVEVTERVRAVLPGAEVRTLPDESGAERIVDVLLGGWSIGDGAWSALVARLPDLPWIPWEVAPAEDCGALAVLLDAAGRPGATSAQLGSWPTREQGPRVVAIEGAATLIAVGGA